MTRLPRFCAVDRCGEKHYSRGYCRRHYWRFRVYGDPQGSPEPRPPWEHGTVTGYKNHGCRCDPCRVAAMAYEKQRVVGTCARCGGPTVSKYEATHCRSCRDAIVEAQHGTEARYRRCRCDECRSAAATARRRRRAAARVGAPA